MNTYSLCHNAPISEFVEMLRDWLIASNANPRATASATSSGIASRPETWRRKLRNYKSR